MRALRWILVIGAVLVVVAIVAIAAGAAWLNSFIHSDSFRQEVELRAGMSLGGTVQIKSVDFDLFNGVKLQGLVTQVDAGRFGGQGALQATIANVNCTYAWKELFNRRLKLTGVTLDQPQIILTKEPTQPLAPSETTTGNNPLPGEATSSSSPASSSPTTSPPPTATPAVSSSVPVVPFEFILDRAKIKDGSVSIRDANGVPMVGLQGVSIDANTSGIYQASDVTGTLNVANLALPPNVHVTDFTSPVVYHVGAFSAKPFKASAFGGSVAGGYDVGVSGPSVLDLNGKGFDLSQVIAATAGSDTSVRLTGSLDLTSKWRGIEAGDVNGEGDAQIANGKIEGVKFLQDISQILRIKELDSPVITKGQAHFLVQDRQVKIIGLQLDSIAFRITGDGTIGFDGSLNANLVLILTRDAMARLPKEIAASFVQQQDGTGSIAFQVTGTTSHPNTDLPQRLLMQNTQIKNIFNKALNKFFH